MPDFSVNHLPVYQTLDLPLKKILIDKIHKREWVLPAIQREFVWSDNQIRKLFDSMMRGYPFGTFLFWEIDPSTAAKFQFYEFMRRYHEKNAYTCSELGTIITENKLTAVLDGQQRLTALNIGVTGSRAHKLPNKRRDNVSAYPETFLHLDLISDSTATEDGMEHDFRFLTIQKAKDENQRESGQLWFRVSDIMDMQEGFGVFSYVQSANLSKEVEKLAYNRLDALHRLIHKTPIISCYTERNQDLERVLEIFIRMNSGGSVLSKSDLLFSTAVANWSLDARREINDLASLLNETGGGFSFSKDFILKAGLMLAGIQSVGFKVDNFNRENMRLLEQAWPDIKKALSLTVRL